MNTIKSRKGLAVAIFLVALLLFFFQEQTLVMLGVYEPETMIYSFHGIFSLLLLGASVVSLYLFFSPQRSSGSKTSEYTHDAYEKDSTLWIPAVILGVAHTVVMLGVTFFTVFSVLWSSALGAGLEHQLYSLAVTTPFVVAVPVCWLAVLRVKKGKRVPQWQKFVIVLPYILAFWIALEQFS